MPLSQWLAPAGGEMLDRYQYRAGLAYALAALFALLLVLGLLLGGFNSVLANGRVICNDCIGIF